MTLHADWADGRRRLAAYAQSQPVRVIGECYVSTFSYLQSVLENSQSGCMDADRQSRESQYRRR